jgi:MEMO1 family protein
MKLPEKLYFTQDEADMLFSIARKSIRSMLTNKKKLKFRQKEIFEKLKIPMGAFVTLKLDGLLRGCIGRFSSRLPLYKVIRDSACSSAFDDPRFPELSEEDYENIKMEITVLGPLKKIAGKDEIQLGKHGIYIKKDSHSGTMLPQVAIENNWTVEEFLGYTSRDKVGLGWDGWKDAEIYIYEGVVLEE